MKAYYFKISGKALVDMFRVSGMRMPDDARIVKTGATAGLNNDFWIMVESETEGSEFVEGAMPEEHAPEYESRADLACAMLREAAEKTMISMQKFSSVIEEAKRRII